MWTDPSLQIAPSFNSPDVAAAAPPEVESTPAMEGVRDFLGGTGTVLGEFKDAALSEAGRPLTGALMSVLAFTLAWKLSPMLMDKLVPFHGMVGGGIKGVASMGLAAMAALGAYELGNNGFDMGKTADALGRDAAIVGDMVGDGVSGGIEWVGNKFD